MRKVRVGQLGPRSATGTTTDEQISEPRKDYARLENARADRHFPIGMPDFDVAPEDKAGVCVGPDGHCAACEGNTGTGEGDLKMKLFPKKTSTFVVRNPSDMASVGWYGGDDVGTLPNDKMKSEIRGRRADYKCIDRTLRNFDMMYSSPAHLPEDAHNAMRFKATAGSRQPRGQSIGGHHAAPHEYL